MKPSRSASPGSDRTGALQAKLVRVQGVTAVRSDQHDRGTQCKPFERS